MHEQKARQSCVLLFCLHKSLRLRHLTALVFSTVPAGHPMRHPAVIERCVRQLPQMLPDTDIADDQHTIVEPISYLHQRADALGRVVAHTGPPYEVDTTGDTEAKYQHTSADEALDSATSGSSLIT